MGSEHFSRWPKEPNVGSCTKNEKNSACQAFLEKKLTILSYGHVTSICTHGDTES